MKLKVRWIKSFRYAIVGLRQLLASEPNARFHLMASILVIVLCIIFPVNIYEWCLLLICIGFVWMAEAFNTAIERLSDRVTSDQDPLIKQTKDLAAAGVLIASFTALIIGLLIIGRHVVVIF